MARCFAFISELMVPIMWLELTAAATLESAGVAATAADGGQTSKGSGPAPTTFPPGE